MTKEVKATMTCIGCPLGCRLELTHLDGEIIRVEGYGCKKGDTYARQEFSDPRRNFATTITLDHGELPRLPVKTAQPIPKGKLLEAARFLHTLRVSAPVTVGQVIVPDILNTGVAIVATREVPKVA